LILEQEKVRRLIETLASDSSDAAAARLVERGPTVVPALLEALERRDVDMRIRARAVLLHLMPAAATFDPYAQEAVRRQQIAALRDTLDRKAG
jgi:hypothetical protein